MSAAAPPEPFDLDLTQGRPESERVPPGQALTRKFPVLTHGATPRFDAATWEFRTKGSVGEPLRLSWEAFRALPSRRVKSDFHCVTGWSALGMVFEGVAVSEVIARTRPAADVAFVVAECEGGYTANLPLSYLTEPGVLLAWGVDGADLSEEHGFPLRLLVPKLYAWKSAKWVRALRFQARDQRGFWEERGYHNHADPWREQRYSWEETDGAVDALDRPVR